MVFSLSYEGRQVVFTKGMTVVLEVMWETANNKVL